MTVPRVILLQLRSRVWGRGGEDGCPHQAVICLASVRKGGGRRHTSHFCRHIIFLRAFFSILLTYYLEWVGFFTSLLVTYQVLQPGMKWIMFLLWRIQHLIVEIPYSFWTIIKCNLPLALCTVTK